MIRTSTALNIHTYIFCSSGMAERLLSGVKLKVSFWILYFIIIIHIFHCILSTPFKLPPTFMCSISKSYFHHYSHCLQVQWSIFCFLFFLFCFFVFLNIVQPVIPEMWLFQNCKSDRKCHRVGMCTNQQTNKQSHNLLCWSSKCDCTSSVGSY